MRFNIPGKQLMQELANVSKVINAKNAISILDNFLFEVNGDLLTVTGSDNDNTLTSTMQIMDVEGDGSIAIPAKRLLDTLKEIPDQPLTFYINIENKEVDLKYLNGHITFVGHSGEEYPKHGDMDVDCKTLNIRFRYNQERN